MNSTRKMSTRKMSTRKLTVTGMMVAITALLAYSPLGVIPMQPVSATITHIPTIIIAILEGPLVGAITGAAFGITTLIKAITQPAGVLDPCFINPLVSVLPRILIGIVAGYMYKMMFFATKKKSVSIVIASALGSLTNTIGAMGMVYLLYAKSLTVTLGTAAGPVLWGIIITYGIMEMIAAIFICTAVVLAMKKAVYSKARMD